MQAIIEEITPAIMVLTLLAVAAITLFGVMRRRAATQGGEVVSTQLNRFESLAKTATVVVVGGGIAVQTYGLDLDEALREQRTSCISQLDLLREYRVTGNNVPEVFIEIVQQSCDLSEARDVLIQSDLMIPRSEGFAGYIALNRKSEPSDYLASIINGHAFPGRIGSIYTVADGKGAINLRPGPLRADSTNEFPTPQELTANECARALLGPITVDGWHWVRVERVTCPNT